MFPMAIAVNDYWMNSVRYDSLTISGGYWDKSCPKWFIIVRLHVFLALGHKRFYHTRENTPLVLTTHIARTCFIRILYHAFYVSRQFDRFDRTDLDIA